MSEEMTVGLLWFCDDPRRTIEDIVLAAVQRYREKYGREPDTCYVHPSALASDVRAKTVGGVRVSSQRSVLLHHYWIGVEEKPKRRRGALTQEVLL